MANSNIKEKDGKVYKKVFSQSLLPEIEQENETLTLYKNEGRVLKEGNLQVQTFVSKKQ